MILAYCTKTCFGKFRILPVQRTAKEDRVLQFRVGHRFSRLVRFTSRSEMTLQIGEQRERLSYLTVRTSYEQRLLDLLRTPTIISVEKRWG